MQRAVTEMDRNRIHLNMHNARLFCSIDEKQTRNIVYCNRAGKASWSQLGNWREEHVRAIIEIAQQRSYYARNSNDAFLIHKRDGIFYIRVSIYKLYLRMAFRIACEL